MRQTEVFTSRWALILATLGMAIGTGNIWRFPRIVAQNGGGSFLIPWIIFLFLWSIPLLIVEFAIGKKTRYGTIGSFGTFLGRKFTWMGAFVGFCTMAIMFYYSVVMGWCVKYFIASVFGDDGLAQSELFWDSFTSSYEPILFHFIAMAFGAFVIFKGVDPEGWWNPFHTYSLGTCLFQWGLAIGLFLLLNNWLYKKTFGLKKS